MNDEYYILEEGDWFIKIPQYSCSFSLSKNINGKMKILCMERIMNKVFQFCNKDDCPLKLKHDEVEVDKITCRINEIMNNIKSRMNGPTDYVVSIKMFHELIHEIHLLSKLARKGENDENE